VTNQTGSTPTIQPIPWFKGAKKKTKTNKNKQRKPQRCVAIDQQLRFAKVEIVELQEGNVPKNPYNEKCSRTRSDSGDDGF